MNWSTEYLQGKADGLMTAEKILLSYESPDPKIIAKAVITGIDADSNSVIDSIKVDIIRELNKVISHNNYEEIE